jgi:hypothetical protein
VLDQRLIGQAKRRIDRRVPIEGYFVPKKRIVRPSRNRPGHLREALHRHQHDERREDGASRRPAGVGHASGQREHEGERQAHAINTVSFCIKLFQSNFSSAPVIANTPNGSRRSDERGDDRRAGRAMGPTRTSIASALPRAA